MKSATIIFVTILSICAVYQFIIRPIQKDKKLDVCMDSMWSLYGNNDELYKSKSESCLREFK
ncbi:MAG: hypothetical protein UU28_C0036G0005 [Parcubacteria group bacterium GW2011_GWD2_40_9]|nr:MAG: hypothetical protein UU28_C0036G0005 [Parcubacteria group bacterium GW2011_GWD2_40_9]